MNYSVYDIRSLLVLLALIVVPVVLHAEESKIAHTPPLAAAGDEVVLTVPVGEISRVRALVVRPGGIHPVPLIRSQSEFSASIPLEGAPELRYMLQAQTQTGAMYLSEEYTVLRAGANSGSQKDSGSVEKEISIAEAKVRQLENAIFSLKNADPDDLKKRKARELAKSLVTLSQKERDLSEAREKSQEVIESVIRKKGITVSTEERNSAVAFVGRVVPRIRSQ